MCNDCVILNARIAEIMNKISAEASKVADQFREFETALSEAEKRQRSLTNENEALWSENQSLRSEINRLRNQN